MNFFEEVSFEDKATAAGALHAAIARSKVVCLRDVPPSLDRDRFYQDIARHTGHFHFKNEDPHTGRLDQDGWLDMRYRAELADTIPYRYGNGRMGLHIDGAYTDISFDLIFFYCERQAQYGGATTVIDSSLLIDYLRCCDPDLLHQLSTAPVLFGKGEKQRRSLILDLQPACPVFNWNANRVSSDNPPAILQMTQRFDAFCERQLVDGGLMTPVLLAPGESLFIHNRLVLHGRTSFWGARCLMKGAISLAREALPHGSA